MLDPWPPVSLALVMAESSTPVDQADAWRKDNLAADRPAGMAIEPRQMEAMLLQVL